MASCVPLRSASRWAARRGAKEFATSCASSCAMPRPVMPDGNSRSALSPSIVFAPAASKCRRLLQVNAMDERVGMTMHQLPFRAVFAVDLGYAERPVLVGQAANLGSLPLDHDENDEPVRRIGLRDFQAGFTVLEKPC